MYNLLFFLFSNRLIAKDGGNNARLIRNAKEGSVYHQIKTRKKPDFAHVLSEGLERTIQEPNMAYLFTYGAVIAEKKFRCKVKILTLHTQIKLT